MTYKFVHLYYKIEEKHEELKTTTNAEEIVKDLNKLEVRTTGLIYETFVLVGVCFLESIRIHLGQMGSLKDQGELEIEFFCVTFNGQIQISRTSSLVKRHLDNSRRLCCHLFSHSSNVGP